jgi:hypothetical protein
LRLIVPGDTPPAFISESIAMARKFFYFLAIYFAAPADRPIQVFRPVVKTFEARSGTPPDCHVWPVSVRRPAANIAPPTCQQLIGHGVRRKNQSLLHRYQQSDNSCFHHLRLF